MRAKTDNCSEKTANGPGFWAAIPPSSSNPEFSHSLRTKPPIKAERDLDWTGMFGSSNFVGIGLPKYFWEGVVTDDFYDEKMSRTQEALAATPDMRAQRQSSLAAISLKSRCPLTVNKGDVVLDGEWAKPGGLRVLRVASTISETLVWANAAG